MLINCVAYEEGRKLADIDKRDIKNYLQRPGCFVWVALRDATEEELAEMQEEFDLHALAVEDARHGHQRPKLEEYGDLLFVVVNTVDVVGDELRIGEVDIFVGRKHVTGPLLEYAGKLFGGRVPQVCTGLGEYFRDIYDHLVRLNQSIDTSRDTVT